MTPLRLLVCLGFVQGLMIFFYTWNLPEIAAFTPSLLTLLMGIKVWKLMRARQEKGMMPLDNWTESLLWSNLWGDLILMVVPFFTTLPVLLGMGFVMLWAILVLKVAHLQMKKLS